MSTEIRYYGHRYSKFCFQRPAKIGRWKQEYVSHIANEQTGNKAVQFPGAVGLFQLQIM